MTGQKALRKALSHCSFCNILSWNFFVALLMLASMRPIDVLAGEPSKNDAEQDAVAKSHQDSPMVPTYNRDVRPILADQCFACHGPDSAARKADLRLDHREFAVEMGALAPGEPDESEMFLRITTDDPELVMPPVETKKKLSSEQIEILRRWIANGAEYEKHWSLIPPSRPALPVVRDTGWCKNEIDRFVLSKLEENGLSPAPESEPRSFFRRLHLDITGLPPNPNDIERFVTDYDLRGDVAVSDWIDRLMDLPSWGEHRARYWLDAARYADTHGLHFDNYREIWPYRDWVIEAFNRNLPFDQFAVEQIAGDLLPNPTDEQLIATGFQRCNMTTNEGGTIDEENLANYAADRVQTFAWVFLGSTLNCCQCHDHKFDPFTMRDYYSLAAFFRNTTQPAKDGNVKDGRGPILIVPPREDRDRWHALPKEIAQAKQLIEQRQRKARPDFESWITTATPESLGGEVSADALELHLPLDEGSGQLAHGRIGEKEVDFALTEKTAWAGDGILGPALKITPQTTIDLKDSGNVDVSDAFSVGAWVRVADGNANAAIIARMDEDHAYRGWDVWQQGKTIGMHLIDQWPDNGLKVVTRNDVIKPGQWQHLFIVYDGSGKPDGIDIYIDGEKQVHRIEKNTLAKNATFKTATNLRLGQRSRSAGFRGDVQDLRIYRRPLTSQEIATLAKLAPVRSIVSLPPEKRTDKQTDTLFQFYLATVDREYNRLKNRIAELESERDAIRARSAITHIQEERKDTMPYAHILIRGQYDQKGEKVYANTPAALHPMADDLPKNRLGLARWLVEPANPLTARVTVNRFWQEVFGRGIVATPENFGVSGSMPSHQELLDWLAVEFQETGWDVKRLFKMLLTSATYRQTAAATDEKLNRDRENILLSRGPRFRMDAEMVRDYALASSGLLSRKMFGPGVKPYQPEAIWNIVGLPGGNTREYVQDKGENLYRRSIYTFWKRMAPPPNMEAFNAPSREICTVRRERTNTPLQALVTLNDPQFVEAARALAQNAIKTVGETSKETAEDVLQIAAIRVLGRTLTSDEIASLRNDYQAYAQYYTNHTEAARQLVQVGDSKPDPSITVEELAAWTMVCNQVLNLDETLNK